MGTFVTLGEVLEARGSPLEEDEVWCLLLATVEALLDISKKGTLSLCSVLSPGSVLLSANGSVAFKSCVRYEDATSFTAPEVPQGHGASSRSTTEKMVVYSVGMTLYWCVDYQLPQNQVHNSYHMKIMTGKSLSCIAPHTCALSWRACCPSCSRCWRLAKSLSGIFPLGTDVLLFCQTKT
uniref:KIND domain-containing protein n=1 Tax=Neogobius melanostomus TaxID=47308 RepID=A0A8C6TAD6_9GOBI